MKLLSSLNGRERVLWGAAATGSAIAASVLTRKLFQSSWREVTGKEPPLNPASPDVDWREAVLWSMGVGLCVGLARVAAHRLAASGWRKATGAFPPM